MQVDGAHRDKDGYYQITGRIAGVINVSDHRMGTAKVESALVGNPKVAVCEMGDAAKNMHYTFEWFFGKRALCLVKPD